MDIAQKSTNLHLSHKRHAAELRRNQTVNAANLSPLCCGFQHYTARFYGQTGLRIIFLLSLHILFTASFCRRAEN